MSRRYGDPIQVTEAQCDPTERQSERRPTSFTWRGQRYWVEVISTWHLRDRWWEVHRHSDRHYFRVVTADHQVFELYHDTASGVWVLDMVQD